MYLYIHTYCVSADKTMNTMSDTDVWTRILEYVRISSSVHRGISHRSRAFSGIPKPVKPTALSEWTRTRVARNFGFFGFFGLSVVGFCEKTEKNVLYFKPHTLQFWQFYQNFRHFFSKCWLFLSKFWLFLSKFWLFFQNFGYTIIVLASHT